MKEFLANETQLYDTGVLSKIIVESNLNICKLKNGHIAIGLREGQTSIVHELTLEAASHVIEVLSGVIGEH